MNRRTRLAGLASRPPLFGCGGEGEGGDRRSGGEALADPSVEVVYQAAFSTDEFVGFADFLVHEPDGGSGLSPDVIAVPLATGIPAKLWSFIEDGQNKNPTGITVDSAGEIYIHGRSQWAISGALSTTGTGGGGI